MKLYIKQQVFSWVDRFSVREEGGGEKYFVEGELFSWGKKLRVYDAANRELAYIQQRIISLLPRYRIFLGGQWIGELVKEFTFFFGRYHVEGLDWDIEGDLWAHEYTVLRGDIPIVSISKHWFTWGDSYVLDIADERDELPALAVVLAIDCALAQSNN